MSSFFPIFVDISKVRTVIVGGGKIAQRRIEVLKDFSAQITVIAPELTEELRRFAELGQICWIARPYQEGDFDDPGIGLAVVATNDRGVNHRAGEDADAAGIPVSVADCKEESTFYFPGIAKKGNLVAGITASGADHHQAALAARRVRELWEEL